MQKFFVKENQIYDDDVEIIGSDVNHIINVLRLKIGERILIGNKDDGTTFLCEIKEENAERILATIVDKSIGTTEPKTYIHLFQGIPKADKFEHVIQKGTEIGISEFTPVIMSRCVVKLDEKDIGKKNERWNKIAASAAEQSKRGIIPKVNLAKNFKNIYENLKEYDIVLVAYEEENDNYIKDVLHKIKEKHRNNLKVAIIIGPEGGLEKTEVDTIIQNGGQCLSLGKRILRTETAPLLMATIILYELDDMK